MKRCSQCHIEKVLSDFNKNQQMCRECQKAYMKAYRQTPEYKAMKAKHNKKYRETHKEESKEYYELNKERICANARDRYANNPEILEKQRAYRQANKEIYREYDRKWKANNPDKVKMWGDAYRAENQELIKVVKHNYKVRRRAQEAQGKISTNLISMLKGVQANKCFYCDTELKDYHLDHIIPLSKGGEHKDYNIVLACPTCNMIKSNKDPVMFVEALMKEEYKVSQQSNKGNTNE